jgi:hypothetical protein
MPGVAGDGWVGERKVFGFAHAPRGFQGQTSTPQCGCVEARRRRRECKDPALAHDYRAWLPHLQHVFGCQYVIVVIVVVRRCWCWASI